MSRLSQVHKRFQVTLQVLEGGRGVVKGLLVETDQTQIPAYTFVNPRRILRTDFKTPIRKGMVLRSPTNEVFIVGENGAADHAAGPLWQSWRLFEASGQYSWIRRSSIIDPVTQMKREGEKQDMGMIWVAVEPLDREAPDRQMHTSHEQDRFICGADVQTDDIVNGKKVIRADVVLGVKLGTLTN